MNELYRGETQPMRARYWQLTNRADSRAAQLADRHYSRQTIGARQFTPPGRVLVLVTPEYGALWATSYPFSCYVNRRQHPGAFVCSIFRNESLILSSALIREAIAITLWRYPNHDADGMVTFVNGRAVRPTNQPGWCFIKAGFVAEREKTRGGLTVLYLPLERFPDPLTPLGVLA